MVSQEELAHRVVLGARLLDEKGPANWRAKIRVDSLDLANAKLCVLGQVYGDYDRGANTLGMYTYNQRVAHGYTLNYSEIKDLTDAWLVYLSAEPEPEPESTDEFIQRWGAALERMYTNRTAGDHSFTGFVVALMYDLEKKGVHLS